MTIRYNLWLDDLEVPVPVFRAEGREQLHRPWEFRLHFGVAPEEVAWEVMEKLLCQVGRLEWSEDGSLDTSSGGLRRGLVLEVQARDESWEIRFGSRLLALDQTQDYRLFLDQDAVEIVQTLLDEIGFEVEVGVHRTLEKRAQCVQNFETPLGFITRLLAEEGIVYFLHPSGIEKLVLVDSPESFPEHEGFPLYLRRASGMITDTQSEGTVLDAKLRRRVRTERTSLRNWNCEAPSVDLTTGAGEEQKPRERYEFHSPYKTTDVGKELAQVRLEAHARDAVVMEARTTSRTLAPGMTFDLESEEPAFEGKWLVTSVRHEYVDTQHAALQATEPQQAERDYQAHLFAVPAERGYRPPVPATRRTRGLRTVNVTGAAGSEIHPDEMGRVKIKHRWDRSGPEDDQSSAWTRVVQPALSGSMLLPRVGWEVLCAHWGTGTDEPTELGRLVNGEALPPNSLPSDKVWNAYGTQSTPGGGPGNRIAFDDSAGNEGMSWNAGFDKSDKTCNDKTTTIKADETTNIGANHTLITGQVHTVSVAGAQDYTVGSRKVGVDANKVIEVGGTEAVTIGGLRAFQVGGTQSIECKTFSRIVGGAKGEVATGGESRKILGTSTTLIGGILDQQAGSANAVSVAGANTEVVAGLKKIKAGKYEVTVGTLGETFGATSIKGAGVHFDFGSKIGINAGATTFDGSTVVFEAESKITIKAGGATITIEPSSVTIAAEYKASKKATASNTRKYD